MKRPVLTSVLIGLGALVYKAGAVGQWGSRLFVSSEPAETLPTVGENGTLCCKVA